jgi:ornithine carbamoyltransferase
VEKVPAQNPEYDARLTRHFLTGEELTGDELSALVERALELKADRMGSRTLEGKSVALVFERPSTRTRVSFQVGVAELGGNPIVLREGELQLERGESIRDTALVLSRYVHAIGVRTGPHTTLEELAAYATVPVINMLTYEHHPCQVLADLVTLRELFGRLEGVKLAYVGDGNNMARSLVLLGRAAGVEVAVASPPELALPDGPNAELDEAVAGADAIYTDVWVSMGDEQDAQRRRELLAPYRIDEQLLERAGNGAVALHCLPAHAGEEISEGVLYGERSAVWDQAENRLHAQKALLELLLGG